MHPAVTFPAHWEIAWSDITISHYLELTVTVLGVVTPLLFPPQAQTSKDTLPPNSSFIPTHPIAFDSLKLLTNFQLPKSILAGLLISPFSTNQNNRSVIAEAHGMAPPRAGAAWGGESTVLGAVRRHSSVPLTGENKATEGSEGGK